MQRRYDYDASYLREAAAVSGGGAVRLGFLSLYSSYAAGAPVDLWAGTAVASTRDGDCGPCLQLVVDMAVERGANPAGLRAVLQGDTESAGDVGLGYRFGEAVIHDAAALEDLRTEIRDRFGDRALVSLSIAAATGRAWPVIKRGLGHGRVCQSVTVDAEPIAVHRESGVETA